MASDTIKELQLSRIYRRHLNKLDVEIISNNTLKNSRSNNFPYELGSKIVQEILNESKKYYLTE